MRGSPVLLSVTYSGRTGSARMLVAESLVPNVGDIVTVHAPDMRGRVMSREWVYRTARVGLEAGSDAPPQRPTICYIRLWPVTEV